METYLQNPIPEKTRYFINLTRVNIRALFQNRCSRIDDVRAMCAYVCVIIDYI